MRVCQVIASLDPRTGGPPVVARSLASALAGLGHDVTLLGHVPSDRASQVEESLRQTHGMDRVRIASLSGARSGFSQWFGSRFASMLESHGPFDVVHTHGAWDPEMIETARWARRAGVPYVITPHGMLDYWTMRQKGFKKRVALRTTHARAYRGASAIHLLNEHEKAATARFNFGVPLEVIPNGVFLEDVRVETPARMFRDSLPALGERRYLLFLGRLHYKKGLDLLAEAWVRASPSLPDVALVVVGPREDDVIDVFNATIDRGGARESVFVLDPMYGPMKSAALREASAFTLPSRQEGFSIAITEALALGTPVIISHDCHFPEVEQAGAGIAHSLEPQDIARAFVRLFGDTRGAQAMGQAGAALVRERYTWPAVAERCQAMYERIVR